MGENIFEMELTPSDFKRILESDDELREFLTLPYDKLPFEYRCLVKGILINTERRGLLNAIRHYHLCIGFPIQVCENVKSFFLIEGDKVVGFVGYYINDNSITDFKIFTFKPSSDGNIIPVEKLDKLLGELIQKYDSILMRAFKDDSDFFKHYTDEELNSFKYNPENLIYQQMVEKYGGYSVNGKRKKDLICYIIEKKK
jgi:hypothetical protein